jgi:Flp pilus assembly protein TadG
MSRRALSRARVRVSRKSRNERGAAALEFALVAPLLFGLILGIISYGYMLSFRQGISQGAAEGARAAAVAPASFSAGDKASAARKAVNDALEGYGVSCSEGGMLSKDGESVGTCSTTVAACANNASRQCASVRVNYAYRDNPLLPSFPGLGAALPEALDYTAVAEVS